MKREERKGDKSRNWGNGNGKIYKRGWKVKQNGLGKRRDGGSLGMREVGR